MFEVVISNINTGRVWRRLFETRDEADQHIDCFLDQPLRPRGRPRNRRHYRVEVFLRPRPELLTVPASMVPDTTAA